MEFPIPSDFDDIFLEGLDQSDLVSLLNQNKFETEIKNRRVELIDPKKREVISIGNGKVIFKNREILVYLLATAFYQRYVSGKDFKGTVDKFRDLNDMTDYSRVEFYFFYILNLNNVDWIDLFNSNDKEGYYFFHVFNGLANSISYRAISPTTIIQIVKENYEVLKGDMAFGTLLNAMNRRATSDSKWAKEAFDAIKLIDPPYVYDLLPCVVKGISVSQGNTHLKAFVEDNLRDTDHAKVKLGIMCMGFLTYKETDDTKWLEELLMELKSSSLLTEEIHTLIVMALTNIISVTTVCQSLMEEYSKSESNSIKPAVANCLFSKYELHLNDSWFKNCLLALAHSADIEKSQTYFLEMLLSQVAPKRPDIFVSFFEVAISSKNFKLELPKVYKNCFTYLYNNNRPAFNDFLSEWLNKDHPLYQLFLEIVIRELSIHGYTNLEINSKFADELNEEDLFFVVHKIVGFIHDNKVQTYLLLSCIQSKNCTEDVRRFVHEVFRDHVCYNYPSTNDFLDSISKNYKDSTNDFISKVVNDSREYFRKRSSVKPIKEILGSDYRTRLFISIRNKQSQKAMEEAQSRSFFSTFGKKVGLKGGQYWFAKYKGVYQNKSELNRIEHGMEMPRGIFIDPVGQNIIQTRFRLYQRQK